MSASGGGKMGEIGGKTTEGATKNLFLGWNQTKNATAHGANESKRVKDWGPNPNGFPNIKLKYVLRFYCNPEVATSLKKPPAWYPVIVAKKRHQILASKFGLAAILNDLCQTFSGSWWRGGSFLAASWLSKDKATHSLIHRCNQQPTNQATH